MRWRFDYEAELVAVFREAEGLIDAYPAPLNARGRDYLQAFNPLNPASTKNHICYLLPFWMAPVAPLEPRQYRDLSLANVFVMLYFFIQDDLMDAAPADWKEQLALGNLFHASMLDRYLALFDGASPFWGHFRAYVTDWALAVACEQPESSLDPSRLSRKAAPVKLASTGALLLAGKQPLEAAVSEAVDLALATLQFSDDWADWEEDFDLRNANSLIGMIAAERSESAPALMKNDVKNAIYVGGALTRYAELAAGHGRRMDELPLSIPHLTAFQSHLSASLAESADLLALTKRQLLHGGFSHWLSTNIPSGAGNERE